MDLSAYEASGRLVYQGLAAEIAQILKAAVDDDPTLRLQQIQHRAKEVPSLAKKMQDAGVADGADIRAVAKDLAGVRLIFPSNKDVERFLSSGIMGDNFDVDLQRTLV